MVKDFNTARHNSIVGRVWPYEAEDMNPNEPLLQFVPFAKYLRFKKGEPVMGNWNLNVPAGLVNGTLADIIDLNQNSVTIRLQGQDRTFTIRAEKVEVKNLLTGVSLYRIPVCPV